MTVDRKWELYEEYLESWIKEIKCTRDKYAKPYSFSEFCDVLIALGGENILMRITGFQCDRCGKIVTDEDYCKLRCDEVGVEFLEDFPELGELELCDDCYEKFVQGMRNFISSYMNYFGSGHNEEDEE